MLIFERLEHLKNRDFLTQTTSPTRLRFQKKDCAHAQSFPIAHTHSHSHSHSLKVLRKENDPFPDSHSLRIKGNDHRWVKALLGGNLKWKIAESSLPRNLSCSDFEKFCQERPWAISKNSSGIFPDFAVILRNLVLATPISITWAECTMIQKKFRLLKMYHKRQTKLFYTFAIIVNLIYVNLWKLWS